MDPQSLGGDEHPQGFPSGPHVVAWPRCDAAMHTKDALGRYGEALAARFLQQHGWTLLDRNWRCPDGELDIVATRHDLVAVCEVKTRRSLRFGSPLEAVTVEKAQRLRRLAAQWLAAHAVRRSGVRIDVITVLIAEDGTTTLQHLEGVC